MKTITELAATGTPLELELADTLGTIKFTRLAPATPKRSQLTANRVGGSGTRWHPAAVAGGVNTRIRRGAVDGKIS